MVRAMLFQYNLFTPLWAHAMMYAVKLYNAGLVKRLNKTRHEAFIGTIPDVTNYLWLSHLW
jgi:hypothetical protein